MALAEAELDRIDSGEEVPPSLLDWESIEQQTSLELDQQSAFCASLSAPGVDNGIGALLSAGINALSVRFRRRPAPDELESILSTAATFAAKTCPAWGPRDPSPTTPPKWYPDGYVAYILNPSIAWAWAAPGFECPAAGTKCWQVLLITRGEACDAAFASLTAFDAGGTAVGEIPATALLLTPGEPHTLTFETTDQQAATGRLTMLKCVDTTMP